MDSIKALAGDAHVIHGATPLCDGPQERAGRCAARRSSMNRDSGSMSQGEDDALFAADIIGDRGDSPQDVLIEGLGDA
jgi:hypothetical protein